MVALDGLSLAVPPGSITGLLGPNGSGKTTTVSILSTALRPDGGRAPSCTASTSSPRRRGCGRVIGFAGQFAAVDPNLTGRENLTLSLGRLSGSAGTAGAAARAEAAPQPVRTRRRGRPAGTGLLRRDAAAARSWRAALVHRPPVLFLDEPTTGLDPESRVPALGVGPRPGRAGTTVLLTTQYLEEADAAGRPGGDHRPTAGSPTPERRRSSRRRFGTVVFTLGFARPGRRADRCRGC